MIVRWSDEVEERGSMGDFAAQTVATREPSRNLRSVSAVPASVDYRGPSQAFVALTRNPSLEPPARFEPTVKGENDVVI